MMKIKTSELSGAALDWAVAEAHYQESPPLKSWALVLHKHGEVTYPYSTAWDWGGPIIEREEIGVVRNAPCSRGREWEARPSITAKGAGGQWSYGPTPLIAAMRCYVASKLGDTIDIPEDLT